MAKKVVKKGKKGGKSTAKSKARKSAAKTKGGKTTKSKSGKSTVKTKKGKKNVTPPKSLSTKDLKAARLKRTAATSTSAREQAVCPGCEHSFDRPKGSGDDIDLCVFCPECQPTKKPKRVTFATPVIPPTTGVKETDELHAVILEHFPKTSEENCVEFDALGDRLLTFCRMKSIDITEIDHVATLAVTEGKDVDDWPAVFNKFKKCLPGLSGPDVRRLHDFWLNCRRIVDEREDEDDTSSDETTEKFENVLSFSNFCLQLIKSELLNVGQTSGSSS